MSTHQLAVAALADVLGYTLIKSRNRNPFSRAFGKYCLLDLEAEKEEMHRASLRHVQVRLCDEAGAFTSSELEEVVP